MSLVKAAFATGTRRQPEGLLGHILKFYAVATAAYTVYAAGFSTWDVLGRTIIFLCLMLVLVFLLVGHSEKAGTKPTIIDYALSALAFGCLVFFSIEIDNIAVRVTLFDPLTPSYWFFGTAIVLLSLEAARRTVGLGLTAIVLGFIGYNLLGHLLSGPMQHGFISFSHFIDVTVFTTDGLFGVPVQVTATYAFLFVMFGTFLERAGGGKFFFDLAAAFTGRQPGGPAKVAVFSSALFGTMSGSPTSDVVTTGSVTIPMMKKLKYSPVYAGAVEVAASTGGSILPPVMGSAVFIMAEFTGIAYLDIAIAGIVPALLYYLGIYLQVHLRSLKLGLFGLPEDSIPKISATFRSGGIFIIPLATLVTALVLHYTPTFVALYGVLSVVVIWLFRRGFTPHALYDSVAKTTFNMVAVTGATAAAGLVIGGITMTGLAGKVSDLLIILAGSSQLLMLLAVAVATIILGMGMPTPAAYALAAALIGPTLTGEFGIPLLQAHFFLLYYAVLSALTPPVAVAAYAASAIAQENPIAIAIAACRLAVAAFVLPFAFIYSPGILFDGEVLDILVAVVTAIAGVVMLSIAGEGYLKGPLSWWQRILLGCAGLGYLAPSMISLFLGTALVAVTTIPRFLPAFRPGRAGLKDKHNIARSFDEPG